MRLVIDPTPRADGTMIGVLEIDLKPGWKTYWRDPGSSGIPPTLDLDQSRGVALESFRFPPPIRVDDGYAIWAGYTAPVRFPLTLRRTVSGDAGIEAIAFVGVCDKICIPFQADLTVELPENATVSDTDKRIVAEAIALLPEAAGVDFKLESAAFNVERAQLEISAILPAFRPARIKPELFVAGPPGYAFAPPVLLNDEGGVARWSVRVEGFPAGAVGVDLAAIDAVVTLGRRAMSAGLQAAQN